MVPELGREDIGEILRGTYRIIYRVGQDHIGILTVYYSAKLPDAGGH